MLKEGNEKEGNEKKKKEKQTDKLQKTIFDCFSDWFFDTPRVKEDLEGEAEASTFFQSEDNTEQKELDKEKSESKELMSNTKSKVPGESIIKEINDRKKKQKKVVSLDLDVNIKRRDPLEKYRRLMENGEGFSVKFTSITEKGTLCTQDEDGIVILLGYRAKSKSFYRKSMLCDSAEVQEKEKISYSLRQKNKHARRLAELQLPHIVCVSDVNEEKKVVHVSEKIYDNSLRESTLTKLKQCLAEGKYPKVPARVIGCPSGKDGMILVDIGMAGIPGIIPYYEWSTAYTSSVVEIGKEMAGHIIEVVVIYEREKFIREVRRDVVSSMFNCSRRLTIEGDPWEGISHRFDYSTIVNLHCIEKRERNFFAKIAGLDDINVWCEYPAEGADKIYVGGDYMGYVYKSNEEKHILRVRLCEDEKE